MKQPILELDRLNVTFPLKSKALFSFGNNASFLHAVNGVSLNIFPEETLGLVGESGCGKSTLGKSIVGLVKPCEGSIRFQGADLLTMDPLTRKQLCKDIQMIFQDPYSSLNPRMTVFDILKEPLETHHLVQHRSDYPKAIAELMDMVGLSKRFTKKYPHEFSGGQRQRIAIARALAVKPKLLICDEPVSALDVSIQAQIINLLNDLKKALQLSILFIAHDLSVVRYVSNRVAVMYLGKIIEEADTTSLFENPIHPYARALISAAPVIPGRNPPVKRIILKGDLPSPANLPTGCAFHTRCPEVRQSCIDTTPKETALPHGRRHLCLYGPS